MMLGTPLGGTVLFFPARQQEAETIYRHPTWLGNLEKILYFGRVLWSHNNMKMVKLKNCGLCYLLLWEGVWLLLGMALTFTMEWVVALSAMSRMATVLWLWPLMALMALYLDLRPDTKHCFPNNKWQIYTRAFSMNCYWHCGLCLDYCNLKAYNLIHRYVPCHDPPAVPSWPWCTGLC